MRIAKALGRVSSKAFIGHTDFRHARIATQGGLATGSYSPGELECPTPFGHTCAQ